MLLALDDWLLVDDITNRKQADVLPGLQVEGEDQVPVPLRALHVAAKLVDLAAEVEWLLIEID